jgi:type II secretory pathway pseudopilin PulG
MSPRSRTRAFTLVEVILVGAILSAMLWVGIGRRERDAQVSRAGEHVSDLRRVAQGYLADTGRCPTMLALVERRDVPFTQLDPWGKEYWFACQGGAVTVVSDGVDRKPFTSDDVSDPVAWAPARPTPRPSWKGAS